MQESQCYTYLILKIRALIQTCSGIRKDTIFCVFSQVKRNINVQTRWNRYDPCPYITFATHVLSYLTVCKCSYPLVCQDEKILQLNQFNCFAAKSVILSEGCSMHRAFSSTTLTVVRDAVHLTQNICQNDKQSLAR
jgi:hypothetical protein